jgi:hypothetical protein
MAVSTWSGHRFLARICRYLLRSRGQLGSVALLSAAGYTFLMQLTVTYAETDKPSYLPGEHFVLRIQFAASATDLATVTNVSVDLFRAEKQRNQLAFGFGNKPHITGTLLTVTQKLATELKPGLHFVCGVTLCWGEDGAVTHRTAFEPIFFLIRDANTEQVDRDAIAVALASLEQERSAYAEKEIVTTLASSSKGVKPTGFRVFIFGIGSLLHTTQQMEGFVISPLGRGLSYARMHSIVNQALTKYQLQIPFDAQIDRQNEQATPTFFIEYWRVLALGHDDALNHCRAHADLVFDLLGLDRGQKPREFFCLAIDPATGQGGHLFSIPWYRGNLVSDFNPASTGNLIETVTPKLQNDPFLRLLVRSYAEATSDDDSNIAMLRAWTVLELLADREIQKGQPIFHLDGCPILNTKNNPKDTNAKEARVYELIRSSGVGFPIQMSSNVDGNEKRLLLGGHEKHPGYTRGTRLVTLWDVVRAAYAIRNCIAHEGYFSPEAVDAADPDKALAVDLIKNTPLDPRRWVHDQAHLCVQRELFK